MAPFAIGADQLPFDDYLAPDVLDESYQSAYRLLFARQMVNVLSSTPDPESTSMGFRQYTTQAIVVIPRFAYAVEAFLGAVAIFASVLLFFSLSRDSNLLSDPAALSALMSITPSDTTLLNMLGLLDRVNAKSLHDAVGDCRFALQKESNAETSLMFLDKPPRCRKIEHPRKDAQGKMSEGTVSGVRSFEFTWKTGLVSFGIQVFLFTFMPILFWLTKKNDGNVAHSRLLLSRG